MYSGGPSSEKRISSKNGPWPGQCLFSVENVTVSYGFAPALNGVSLSIPKGMHVGLIGPNGSGKTTLLRALYGGVKPTDGRVHFDNHVVAEMPTRELAKRITLVPQHATAPQQVRVLEEVLLGRMPFMSNFSSYSVDDYQLARQALRLVNLADIEDKYSDQLSGGERQRLIIARAIAQQTDCILLDEPTNHLDIYFQHKILSLLKDLFPSIVTVLHDINLAARYCDWVIMLDQGDAFAEGHPEDVLTEDNIQRIYGVSATTYCHKGKQQFCFDIDKNKGES